MLVRTVLATAIAAMALPPPSTAVSPAPQPAATPALKTIASVRSTSRCAQIITHANSAIATTLNNDAVIGQTITMLRMTNLDDGNAIHRRNGLNALGEMAKKLMMQARAGDDEVKRLRKIAAETKNPDDAKALKQFADELGGALWRQQKIARDLNGYLAYEDFRDMATMDESQRQANIGTFGVPDPTEETPADMPGPHTIVGTGPNAGQPAPIVPPHFGHDPNQPSSNDYARAAAQDFQDRTTGILVDENDAAQHVDGAINGC